MAQLSEVLPYNGKNKHEILVNPFHSPHAVTQTSRALLFPLPQVNYANATFVSWRQRPLPVGIRCSIACLRTELTTGTEVWFGDVPDTWRLFSWLAMRLNDMILSAVYSPSRSSQRPKREDNEIMKRMPSTVQLRSVRSSSYQHNSNDDLERQPHSASAIDQLLTLHRLRFAPRSEHVVCLHGQATWFRWPPSSSGSAWMPGH